MANTQNIPLREITAGNKAYFSTSKITQIAPQKLMLDLEPTVPLNLSHGYSTITASGLGAPQLPVKVKEGLSYHVK
jgi:hypothetical protein